MRHSTACHIGFRHRSSSAGSDHAERVAHRCVCFCRRSRGLLPYAMACLSQERPVETVNSHNRPANSTWKGNSPLSLKLSGIPYADIYPRSRASKSR